MVHFSLGSLLSLSCIEGAKQKENPKTKANVLARLPISGAQQTPNPAVQNIEPDRVLLTKCDPSFTPLACQVLSHPMIHLVVTVFFFRRGRFQGTTRLAHPEASPLGATLPKATKVSCGGARYSTHRASSDSLRSMLHESSRPPE